MNTTLDMQDWYSAGIPDSPRDQQRELHGNYWAETGPRGRRPSDGWWWIVSESGEAADSGCARNEAGAKAAVQDWAEADLLSDQLAAEIADGILSGAFAAYGHTRAAVDAAERAVKSTNQIRRA